MIRFPVGTVSGPSRKAGFVQMRLFGLPDTRRFRDPMGTVDAGHTKLRERNS